jgi:hypothetical protein
MSRRSGASVDARSGIGPTELPDALDMKVERVVLPVSEVGRGRRFHRTLDREHRRYGSFASFSDPDENGSLLQGMKGACPTANGGSRVRAVAALANLLRETVEHHDGCKNTHPPRNSWDRYTAHINARKHGTTPREVVTVMGPHLKRLRHVVPG